MSEPHIVSEGMNPLEYYRRLQQVEGRLAELEQQNTRNVGLLEVIEQQGVELEAEKQRHNATMTEMKRLQEEMVAEVEDAVEWTVKTMLGDALNYMSPEQRDKAVVTIWTRYHEEHKP